jgi:hypothetical protein
VQRSGPGCLTGRRASPGPGPLAQRPLLVSLARAEPAASLDAEAPPAVRVTD